MVDFAGEPLRPSAEVAAELGKAVLDATRLRVEEDRARQLKTGLVTVADPAEQVDLINHPPHYRGNGIEPIKVIEAWGLGFNLGNAVKYIARHEHKGTALADLEKAAWYLNREIERRKEQM
jgi:hypothetical protein